MRLVGGKAIRGVSLLAAGMCLPLLGAPAAGAQPAPPQPVQPGPAGPVGIGPAPGPAPVAAPAAQAPLAAPAAQAGCPHVQVVFARGTTEPPGLGAMGQAFVDDLRARVGPKSVGVYPVNYPASPQFSTAVEGIRDASTHVQQMADNCPSTQLVLGGFSQGAAVMGFVTTDLVPDGVAPADVPAPMPADIASHVAAVALLGTPSDRFMNVIKQPSVEIGPAYEAKTIELCVPNDFVCSPGNDIAAHARYISDGLVLQAADFAAGKLAEQPAEQPVQG